MLMAVRKFSEAVHFSQDRAGKRFGLAVCGNEPAAETFFGVQFECGSFLRVVTIIKHFLCCLFHFVDHNFLEIRGNIITCENLSNSFHSIKKTFFPATMRVAYSYS